MSTVIGIDLGTSTTEAAVYRDGKPELIFNFTGEVITPSAVGIDENGNWVVGERARAQLLLVPENTAVEIKRKIGTTERIMVGGIAWTPVDLSARILEYVRSYAAKYLQEDITRAVISVPAYFNDIQRQETVAAGKKAGLRVERILNEPTAAALSYGMDHMEEESHILVYDLGGGTFDVTLLEMFDGVLEVKASSGDNRLGGKDFDQLLCDWMVGEFRQKHGINLAKSPLAMVRIRDEAERCKIALSDQSSYHIQLPAIAKKGTAPLELDLTMTAERFEQLARELLDRTHSPIETVLQDADMSPEQIDKVILAGGATRMPMISREIERCLGIQPSAAVHPDFAVAEGAAIQAAIISGQIDPMEGLVMTDVNPFSLGVRCFDGFSDDRMSTVIPRNVTIPVTREEVYRTSADYQTKARIEVYQGESDIATSNHFLGKFMIDGIPAKPLGPEGGQPITVRFSYDLNGMLQVEATVDATGKKASIQIDMMNAGEDDEEERIDVSDWKASKLAPSCRGLIRRAERMLKKLMLTEGKDSGQYGLLEESVYLLKRSLVQEEEQACEVCRTGLETMLRVLEESR